MDKEAHRPEVRTAAVVVDSVGRCLCQQLSIALTALKGKVAAAYWCRRLGINSAASLLWTSGENEHHGGPSSGDFSPHGDWGSGRAMEGKQGQDKIYP